MVSGRKANGASAAPGLSWLAPAAVGVILAVGLLIYRNSFEGAFVFDDRPAILQKAPLWRGASTWEILATESQTPVVSLTIAANYWLGGTRTWGYHFVNLLIHLSAALALFGVARRTLLSDRLRGRFGPASTPLAAAAALLWMAHPVQTESVTYIIQRKESLMGLFYLLTLYCAIRSEGPSRAGWWRAGAVASCALGMGTKQVMVTAPLVVLLYDRTFLSGSFRAALAKKWRFYLLLGATWVVLASSVERFQQQGLGVPEMRLTPLQYAQTQFGVVLHYLHLTFWPGELCLDYGWPVARSAGDIWPPALVVGALLIATLVLLWRAPAAGFPAAWFFVTLAPTSSVIVITELAFEHRMYLALAGPAALVAAGGYAAGESLLRRFRAAAGARKVVGGAAAAAAAAAVAVLGYLTVLRNRDYRSEFGIWQDVARKRPDNPRGRYSLGVALARAGRLDEAVAEYRQAIRLKPDYAEAYNNLAAALARQHKLDEAAACARQAVDLCPDVAQPRINLANFLAQQKRFDEAFREYERATDLAPDMPDVHFNYGLALLDAKRYEQAAERFGTVIRLRPRHAEGHYRLGTALVLLERFEEAERCYRQALSLDPDHAPCRSGLGDVLARQGKYRQAVEQYEQALRLDPFLNGARRGLAEARSRLSLPGAGDGAAPGP